MKKTIFKFVAIFLIFLSLPNVSYANDFFLDEKIRLNKDLDDMSSDFKEEFKSDFKFKWISEDDNVCLSKEEGFLLANRIENIPRKCAILCQYKLEKEKARLVLEIGLLKHEIDFEKRNSQAREKLLEERVELLKNEVPKLSTSEAIGIGIGVGFVATVLLFGLSIYGYTQISK